MNYRASVLACVLVAVGLVQARPPERNGTPPGSKPSPEEVRKRVYGCWVETSGQDAGKDVLRGELAGQQLDPDETSVWLVVGEATRAVAKGGVRIDPSKNPMWIDIHNLAEDGKRYIVPGIFKFDGDKLIYAVPDRGTLPLQARRSGEYPERPNDFTSTAENKYSVRVLERTELYGTEPATAGKPAAKMTQAEAERKWADYWIEAKVTAGGKPGDPSWYWGRSFVSDKADGSFAMWLVMGEAVLSSYPGSLKIDVTTDPMRVDLVHTGRVVPGIFRLDGDDLVWVTPREYNPRAAFGCKPMVRPTDFTSTEANGHVVRVMKRTTGLYGIEPVGPKGKK